MGVVAAVAMECFFPAGEGMVAWLGAVDDAFQLAEPFFVLLPFGYSLSFVWAV